MPNTNSANFIDNKPNDNKPDDNKSDSLLWQRVKLLFPILLGSLLFIIAMIVIHRELKAYHPHDVLLHIKAIAPSQWFYAIGFTLSSYLLLSLYDTLALKHIKSPIRWPKILFATFVANVFSYNVGFSSVGGSAVRYRIYRAWQLSSRDIAELLIFNLQTFWLGILVTASIFLTIWPFSLPNSFGIPTWLNSTRPIGTVLFILLIVYLCITLSGKVQITIKRWSWKMPNFTTSIKQMLVGCVDWLVAAAIMAAIIGPAAEISYMHIVGMYVVAQLIGLISNVPGGLGVFDGLFMIFISPTVGAEQALGFLISYRLVYYFVPMILAVILMGTFEIIQNKKWLQSQTLWLQRIHETLVPRTLAVITLSMGVFLLFSGFIPIEPKAFTWLDETMHLIVFNVSHLSASLCGIGLIILAKSLLHRSDGAYYLTLILLITGAAFSLMKPHHEWLAAMLVLMFILFLPCRQYFYRPSVLLSNHINKKWLMFFGAVIMACIWLFWWTQQKSQFQDAHSSASIRALIALCFFTIAILGASLLKTAKAKPEAISQETTDIITDLSKESESSSSYLALLGDKQFIVSPKEDAFIMYGLSNKTWVAMGDPVGNESSFTNLVWDYYEMVDKHQGHCVFYEATEKSLPYLLDIGLRIKKIGEQAKVALPEFKLTGKSMAPLRQQRNYVQKHGGEFVLLSIEQVASELPAFKAISDDWLNDKSTREKGFSLGYFNDDYIKQTPIAAVRVNNEWVAFANLWLSANKNEISIDLMRYNQQAPRGVMDYLFTELMLWGQEEGYQWFDLGMAPLSGMQEHHLAPIWQRFGSLIYAHGNHFYHFSGLKQYKNKFRPHWEPRYLAHPSGLNLPIVLKDTAALIAGGVGGILRK